MLEEEQLEFKNLIIEVAEVYSKSINEIHLNAFWQTLRIYSLHDIKIARAEIYQTCEYFPVPEKFVRILRESENLIACDAWSNFMGDLQRGVESDDKTTREAAKLLGGWRHLSRINLRDLDFKRAPFLALYKDCSERARRTGLLEFKENTDISRIAAGATKRL